MKNPLPSMVPRRDALRLWGFSEKVGYFGKIHKILLNL